MLKILNYLIYLTIFSLPLYVIRGNFFGIPITFLEILILVTFAFWVIKVIIEKDFKSLQEIAANKRLICVWLFLIAGIISTIISPDKKAALGILKAYILEPILFFIVLFSVFKEPKQLTGVFYSLLISGVMTSIIAVSQKLTGTDVYAPHEISQGRVTGFFNSANALCLYLIPITVLLLSKIVVLMKRKQLEQTKAERKKTFWLMLCLVLFLSVIYLTQSSGGMLAAIAAFVVVIVLHPLFYPSTLRLGGEKDPMFQKLGSSHLVRTINIGVSLYFVVQLLFFTLISNWTPKLSERPFVRQFQDTLIVRLCLWEGTWNLLQNKLILGVGLSNFPSTYYNYVTCDSELLQYPHNLILNFWSEMGLLGLISFGLMIICYITNVFSYHPELVTAVGVTPQNAVASGSRKIPDQARLAIASAKRVRNDNTQITNYWQIGLIGILIYYLIHGLVDVPYFKNDLSLMWFLFLGLSFVITKQVYSDRK